MLRRGPRRFLEQGSSRQYDALSSFDLGSGGNRNQAVRRGKTGCLGGDDHGTRGKISNRRQAVAIGGFGNGVKRRHAHRSAGHGGVLDVDDFNHDAATGLHAHDNRVTVVRGGHHDRPADEVLGAGVHRVASAYEILEGETAILLTGRRLGRGGAEHHDGVGDGLASVVEDLALESNVADRIIVAQRRIGIGHRRLAARFLMSDSLRRCGLGDLRGDACRGGDSGAESSRK